jgi:hypothetical protein
MQCFFLDCHWGSRFYLWLTVRCWFSET